MRPLECVYAGDGYSNELKGVSKVGMSTLLIARPEMQNAAALPDDAVTWSGESGEHCEDGSQMSVEICSAEIGI